MAIAKANACCTLTVGTGDSAQEYRIHEGDMVTDLAYTRGQETYTVTGTVRVINATVHQSNYSQTCPPESYFHRLADIVSLIIDCSEQYDADLVTVTVGEITGIGSVSEGGDGEEGGEGDASVTVGPGPQYQALDAVIAAVDAGTTIKLEAGTYAPNLTIDKALTIDGTGAELTGKITIKAGAEDTVTLKGVSVKPASVGAAEAAINIESGNLVMDGATVATTSTGEEACCIRKDSMATGTKTTVDLKNCTISLNEAGTGSAYCYPIELGRFNTSAAIGKYDMSDCDLTIDHCTITGNVNAGQTYAIYSATRGLVNINITNSDLTAWAAVYMNRCGQTESNGTFQDSFEGGKITIDNSTLTGIQPYEAAAEEASENNLFAVVDVQNSKTPTVTITNSTVIAKNNHKEGDAPEKVFAPMLSVDCFVGNTGAKVVTSDTNFQIETPRVEKAIRVDGSGSIDVGNSMLYAVDENGESVATTCTLY